MSSNVVQIDQRASARAVSAEVRRKFLAERSKREVAAIRRNRLARLVTTKRWWWTMIGVTTVVSMSIGACSLWWWQQSVTIPLKTRAVEQLQTTPEAADKVVQPGKPVVAFVASGSPSIPLSPVTAPEMVTAQAPVGRMPPGVPMTPTPVVKQVTPAQGSKQPVPHVPVAAVQPVAPVVQKTQPSTQYEAAATVAKAANPQAVIPNATPVAVQPASVTAPTVTSNAAYQVVGVPVDGVLQIKIGKDPAIKPIRVGERLPSGEVLRRANSDTGQVETSERSFKVN